MSFNKATRICLVGVPRSQISQRAWPFQKNKVKSQLKQKLQSELWLYCLGISLFPWKIPVKTLQKRVSTLLSIFQFCLRSDGFMGETLVHAILFDTQLSPIKKEEKKERKSSSLRAAFLATTPPSASENQKDLRNQRSPTTQSEASALLCHTALGRGSFLLFSLPC